MPHFDTSLDPRMDPKSVSALQHYIFFNENEALKRVFEPPMASLRDAGGHTPLITAALNGNREALLFLLPHSDPNAQNDRGLTALTAAIERGHFSFIPLLAPITDLSLVDTGSHSTALDLLLDSLNGHSAAVGLITPEVVAPLLRGANPLQKNQAGFQSPFEKALGSKNWPIVDLFLLHVEPTLAYGLAQQLGEEKFPRFLAAEEAAALREELGVGDPASPPAMAQSAKSAPSDSTAGDSPSARAALRL